MWGERERESLISPICCIYHYNPSCSSYKLKLLLLHHQFRSSRYLSNKERPEEKHPLIEAQKSTNQTENKEPGRLKRIFVSGTQTFQFKTQERKFLNCKNPYVLLQKKKSIEKMSLIEQKPITISIPKTKHEKKKKKHKKFVDELTENGTRIYIVRSQKKKGIEAKKEANLLLAYSQRRPRLEKTMRATSASQSTDNSQAFLSSPLRRLQKVTCRLVVFSIRLISILPLPIFFWEELSGS